MCGGKLREKKTQAMLRFLMENEKLAVSFVFTSTLNHCAGARCQAVIKIIKNKKLKNKIKLLQI